MAGEIVLVSRGARSREEDQASHLLRFPSHWRAAPVVNPAEMRIERETLEWLAAHGMGTSPAEREKLRKFECGKYGGYSLPRAPLPEALLVTQFISLWLFWDDVEVEDHTDWSIDDVAAAFTAGPSPSTNSYVMAWNDVASRLRARGSARWLARLAESMREWLGNAQHETKLGMALRKRAEWPSLETLFECRTVSIGMYPTFYLIEIAEHLELPDEFHEHDLVKDLKRTASRLVGIGNDLGGLAKDLKSGWLNLVVALAHGASIRIDEAFGRLVEIHNREVLDFDRAAARLPSFGEKLDPLVQTWLEAVRYSVYGFALWESCAERYQEYTALVEGRPLRAMLTIDASAV
ncbi:MAG TPA: terpene synthase family protein [Polyangiaceae bacterium]|nr:terpene synthase family protein [Polyangiaceae bacterium]